MRSCANRVDGASEGEKLRSNFPLSLQGHHRPSNHRQSKLNNKIGVTSQIVSITHLRLIGYDYL